jgi:hypothetical protein
VEAHPRAVLPPQVEHYPVVVAPTVEQLSEPAQLGRPHDLRTEDLRRQQQDGGCAGGSDLGLELLGQSGAPAFSVLAEHRHPVAQQVLVVVVHRVERQRPVLLRAAQ